MKAQKGNVAVIALIIIVVAITTGVITWLVATRTQAPATQPVAQTQPAAKSVAPVSQPAVQPAPADETANWQIYTNEKYGYEIKYPNGWSIDAPNDGGASFYIKDSKRTGDYFYTVTTVTVGKKSLEDWLSEKIRVDKNNYSETVVLGLRTLKFDQSPSSQAPGNIEYYFIKDDTGFILTSVYTDKSNGIGEKILSTFKFTK